MSQPHILRRGVLAAVCKPSYFPFLFYLYLCELGHRNAGDLQNPSLYDEIKIFMSIFILVLWNEHHCIMDSVLDKSGPHRLRSLDQLYAGTGAPRCFLVYLTLIVCHLIWPTLQCVLSIIINFNSSLRGEWWGAQFPELHCLALDLLFSPEEPCRTPKESFLPVEPSEAPKLTSLEPCLTNLILLRPAHHLSWSAWDTACRSMLLTVPCILLSSSGIALWTRGHLRDIKSVLLPYGNYLGPQN